MRVSLNTIKRYIDFELPPIEELVKRINERLGGVEKVVDLSAKYKNAKIVKVVECEKHPNADKLSACKIDAGTGELIQVVCGASNVHAGMWAVWLPPESVVPSTYGTEDEFKLGARELRGIVSNGMLASARELGIGDDHDGIVDINADEWNPSGDEIVPGVSFAKIYGLDDIIIDIENKMFTHRPDLFGQLGIAREIAGILGHKFSSPEWYTNTPEFGGSSNLPLDIFNDAPEKVPRFMAVALSDVTIKPSPLWLQIELMRLGSKAINNIVDATNYVMLLTAQPTHAYDYDKLRGHKLGVRMAREGEKITLLNGKTYDLNEDDIVIADGEGAVGLAGIMGGGETEISSDTKNIVLEVATFDMYTVRKSSMRHGIFTDALTRFNKGQSPLQNGYVMNLLIMSINDVSNAKQGSDVFDGPVDGFGYVDQILPRISANFVNKRLGLTLSSDEIVTLLQNVEIEAEAAGENGLGIEPDDLSIEMPFWRMDVSQPEDIVEEVGRLYGYDKLPRVLPTRSIKPAAKNPSRELKRTIREVLSRAGANEVLTYSFVHEMTLKSVGQDTEKAYRLSNALSPDIQYYRESLVPSLLGHIHPNIKQGYDEFALFELNKIHHKDSGMNEENVPFEHNSLAFVYAGKSPRSGAPFYQTRAYLELVAAKLGLKLSYEPLGADSTSPLAAPFEPKRSAIVSDMSTGNFVGVVGDFKGSVSRNFKLPEYAAGFEVDMDELHRISRKAASPYTPLSRFPGTVRDISFRAAIDVTYAAISAATKEALADTGLETEIQPLGIYQAKDSESKTVTLRISLTPFDRTLTSDDATRVIDEVVEKVRSATGASVI